MHHSAADWHVAFQQTVHVPGAVWMRLVVGDHNLGQERFLSIRSVQTGAVQTMTAAAFKNWSNFTGVFGGDSLEVELHVAPGEQNIFVETSKS